MIAALLIVALLIPAPVVADIAHDNHPAGKAGMELLAAIAANQRAIARVMELLEEHRELKRQRYHTLKGKGEVKGDGESAIYGPMEQHVMQQ